MSGKTELRRRTSPTSIADVLGLYSGGRRATDRVRRLYNADATFEDGIMAVKWVSSVAAQFSALSAVSIRTRHALLCTLFGTPWRFALQPKHSGV